MEDNYLKIEFFAGNTIDTAMNDLMEYRKQGVLACGDFNGKTLYSDKDDLNSAYLKITGKSKPEYDEDRRKEQEEYKRQQQEHKTKIPELTQEWIMKGNQILDKKYHEKWASVVPIRLNDLYQGFELKACLDIINILNNDGTLENAKKEIENQGHSGMSFGLVRSMVHAFCDRGLEFAEFIKL